MPTQPREHHYESTITWTGNTGEGTSNYRSYERSYDIGVDGKPVIHGSSDAAFRGDPTKYTPEDMLVMSLASCHMLWYLHLASVAGIAVTSYVDRSAATMLEEADGSGRFILVTLHPRIEVMPGADLDVARSIHEDAHRMCFVANSVNFPVETEPVFTIKDV
jgi:organic hydroperoxide reductase OsmC/OhrA